MKFRVNEFSVTLDIKAPDRELSVERVWEYLVDWEGQSDWMFQTKVWSDLEGGRENGVGIKISALTGLFAKKFASAKLGLLDEMVVTKWQPPLFCEVDHVGRIIKGLGTFRLEPIDGAIRFHWFERIEAPWPILLLVRPGILAGVHISLRRLRRLVIATNN
ncbi:MAG: SRPBCC family protein [Actinomycetes bacterium]